MTTHDQIQQLLALQSQWRQKTGKQMPDDVALKSLHEVRNLLAVQWTAEQVEAERLAVYGESMMSFDQHNFY